jgi:hypothetical protein
MSEHRITENIPSPTPSEPSLYHSLVIRISRQHSAGPESSCTRLSNRATPGHQISHVEWPSATTPRSSSPRGPAQVPAPPGSKNSDMVILENVDDARMKDMYIELVQCDMEIQGSPKDVTLKIRRAQILVELGHLSHAFSELREALLLDSKNPDLHYIMCQISLR